MALKVAVNGFGRIGRMVLRAGLKSDNIEFAAVNDLADSATLAHLLKYDSVHGILDADVSGTDHSMIVDGKEIKMFSKRDPSELPWGDLGIETVFECTGLFKEREKSAIHIDAGADNVIISAPAKNPDITVVMGVNHKDYMPGKHHIISNASCTTNCLAPPAMVLLEKFGIQKGLMTTTHAYTGDQRILDFPHKDLRRARSAALSMIPTTTGAARAVAEVLPRLKGKLDGMAIRVPTPNVSVVDLTAQLDRSASAKEINDVLKEAADKELKGIMACCDEPLVSTDFNGVAVSSTIDCLSTMAIGDMVKILAWYDNEFGYANRLVDLALYIKQRRNSS